MPRRGRAAIGFATVLVLGVAGLVTGCTSAEGKPAAPTTGQVTEALTARARAVSGHDREAFRSGLADSGPSAPFRTAQIAAYANLAQLSFSTWTYRLERGAVDSEATGAASAKYGRPARIAHVTLTYAVRGFDPRPVTRDLYYTFVTDGDRAVLAGDSDLVEEHAVSWAGPWDFGPLSVVRAGPVLVLGHAADGPLLHQVAGLVGAAIDPVTRVWGSDWARAVVVLVPDTAAEFTAAAGRELGSDVLAQTVTTSVDPVSQAGLGVRLVVNRGAYDRLSPLGRQVTLRHEVTLVASSTLSAYTLPRWLIEGLAEYVGNLDTGQPVTTAAAELAAQVRAGRVPTALPSDRSLATPEVETAPTSAAGRAVAAAYEQSWLACRLIARDVGPAGLMRFYRAVGASYDSTTAVPDALRDVLHLTTGQFVERWRAYLRAELG